VFPFESFVELLHEGLAVLLVSPDAVHVEQHIEAHQRTVHFHGQLGYSLNVLDAVEGSLVHKCTPLVEVKGKFAQN